MIGLVLLRWLLLLGALLALGVCLDRVLTWLDRRGVVRYRAGRSRRSSGEPPVDIRSRRRGRGTDRAPEGFPDDPFPPLDPDGEEEEDEEPPDNVYPFH